MCSLGCNCDIILQQTQTLFSYSRRAVLQKWMQRFGSNATYNNLIGVFERAGFQEYADIVRNVIQQSFVYCPKTNISFPDDETLPVSTPQSPLPQLPVFPQLEPMKSYIPVSESTVILIEKEHPELKGTVFYQFCQ